MKKIIIMVFEAAAATNINAQLVVDSLGRVGIGTETPKSLLSVGDNGNKNSSIYCNSTDKTKGIYVENSTDSISNTYGGQYHVINNFGDCFGINSLAMGGDDFNPSQCVIGLNGVAGFAPTAIGTFGGKFAVLGSPVNFAGVYGAEMGDIPSFSNYSGTYAGYFNGKVRVTNGIYATVLSPVTSPSPSGQNGTTLLSDRGESVTDKLSQVQAVQILRYDPAKETNTTKASFENLDISNLSSEELDSLSKAMGDVEPEPYLSPVQYGLDAAQLKAVYPELVYEDDNGNVSINYVEMVPLLVQSIKELKNELAELKGTSPKKAKTGTTSIEETVSDVDMVRMDQNKPNPFSESTVITLNIPEQTQKASIFIFDMSGKQVQNIAVNERGETNITVYASDLSAGMYIYTLVVDGKVAVTRRMIVSKE